MSSVDPFERQPDDETDISPEDYQVDSVSPSKKKKTPIDPFEKQADAETDISPDDYLVGSISPSKKPKTSIDPSKIQSDEETDISPEDYQILLFGQADAETDINPDDYLVGSVSPSKNPKTSIDPSEIQSDEETEISPEDYQILLFGQADAETDINPDDYLVGSVSPSKNPKTSIDPSEIQSDEETEISPEDYQILLFGENKGNEETETSTSVATSSTSTANIISAERVGQEAAAAKVKYDYIFKRLLTATDVSTRVSVPLAEAEKHFPRIKKKSTVLQVYDINREKRTEWELLRQYRSYYFSAFSANWKEYVKDNLLQVGDSVLFYRTKSVQRKNNDLSCLPCYAVQIERLVTSSDTSVVYIPLDKLVNSKKSDSREVIPDGAETEVKYDYLFKKKLTNHDVRKSSIRVGKREAVEIFSSLEDTDKPINIRVYDNNRDKWLEWELSPKNCCYFSRTLEYVRGNNLKAGDSVLFYKTESNQIVHNEPLPRFAVQFKKPKETIDTSALYIQLDRLVSTEIFASEEA